MHKEKFICFLSGRMFTPLAKQKQLPTAVYLNNSMFLVGDYWMIVDPWKFDILETNISFDVLLS